jgi:hypothetical protein
MPQGSISIPRNLRDLMLGLLLLFGACAAAEQPVMTSENYNSFQRALRGDAGLRRDQTVACIREGSAIPQADREWLAEMLGSQSSDSVRVYCERLMNALALEMVSYEDFMALKTGGADAATALRVLEAVRRVPEPRLTADEFAVLRRQLSGNDAFRDEQTRTCVRELDALWTPAERDGFAADLRVDPQIVVRFYCVRLHNAIAAGRLSYTEWQGLIDMDRYPEAGQRALQVLREEADGLS